MKPIYGKPIAIGLIGVFIIAGLYLFSAYMADQDIQEHYRTSPGSGVLMVGVRWWVFFFAATLVALGGIGAISAWASGQDSASKRDIIRAAALAGGVPVGLAIVGLAFILVVAFINTPADHRMNFISGPVTLFVYFLIYSLAGLMASIAGGLAYLILANWLTFLEKRGLQ